MAVPRGGTPLGWHPLSVCCGKDSERMAYTDTAAAHNSPFEGSKSALTAACGQGRRLSHQTPPGVRCAGPRAEVRERVLEGALDPCVASSVARGQGPEVVSATSPPRGVVCGGGRKPEVHPCGLSLVAEVASVAVAKGRRLSLPHPPPGGLCVGVAESPRSGCELGTPTQAS